MKRHLKKILKFALAGLGLLVLAVAVYVATFWSDFKAFRGVLAAYHSHLYCSCFYVMKQSDEVCEDWSRQYLPIQGFSNDLSNQSVTSRAFGISTKARFVNEKEGCILDSQ